MWSFCVILMYLLGNCFVVYRICCWLKVIHQPLNHRYIKRFLLILYISCASAPLIAYILPKSNIQRCLQIFSNVFFGAYVYMMIVAFLFFIVFLILKFIFKNIKE